MAGWRLHRPRVVVVSVVVAASLAAPYLLLIGYGAPRFLLPAYAVLVVPVAVGVTWAWGAAEGLPRQLTRSAVVLLVGVIVLGQLLILQRVRVGTARSRQVVADQMRTLSGLGSTPPCAVAGGLTNVRSVLSGCRQLQTQRSDLTGAGDVLRAAAQHERVALIAPHFTTRPAWLRDWRRVTVPGLNGSQLHVFLSPPIRRGDRRRCRGRRARRRS